MKLYSKIFFTIIIVLMVGCTSSVKEKSKTTQPELDSSVSRAEDSLPKKYLKKANSTFSNPHPIHYEYLFVNKPTGVSFFKSPGIEELGSYSLNTQLKVIYNPKDTDTISIQNSWLGVENGKDTVYVLKNYLSNKPVISDIQLYQVTAYIKERDGKTRTAFLNLSDSYFGTDDPFYNRNAEWQPVFSKNELIGDTIKLSQIQRKRFLANLNISELDNVFIYQMKSDKVLTFNIKNLPAIACINIYSSDEYSNGEYDYEFGFDLGQQITEWDNLVFIGKENPFQINEFKPIIWTQVRNELFPSPIKNGEDTINLSTYSYSTSKNVYFLQKAKDRAASYHLLVVNKTSKSIIFDRIYSDSEGTHLTQLNIEGQKDSEVHQSQWAGKLFKNKAPVIFGFLGYSFGCPSLTVLDKTEPTIKILCDNRH